MLHLRSHVGLKDKKLSRLLPQDEVFWYLSNDVCKPLTTTIKVDVAVVGGGMAGITAAQSFSKKGLKVALVEKGFCGAGASGKSSGFITPDSEFSLGDMVGKYGTEKAQALWEFAGGGVRLIEKNILDYALDCDYVVQNTLVVASSEKAFSDDISKEHETRKNLKYPSVLYAKNELGKILGSQDYYGGISYPGSFGINSYRYCQGMKRVLLDLGVDVFEETPVLAVEDHFLVTPSGKIEAGVIVLCTDRFTPDLGRLTSQVYHAQTFLLMSSPVADADLYRIFPDRPVMVWDTDLIYNYFRVSNDNRILLGGASLLSTYAANPHYHNERMFYQLTNYFKKKFPDVTAHFEYLWPGLIGISKDIMPLAGLDRDERSIYYIAGAAGLPWAAALGAYSAKRLIDGNKEFDDCFSPYRKFPIGEGLQRILGKKISFALSNFSVVGTL